MVDFYSKQKDVMMAAADKYLTGKSHSGECEICVGRLLVVKGNDP